MSNSRVHGQSEIRPDYFGSSGGEDGDDSMRSSLSEERGGAAAGGDAGGGARAERASGGSTSSDGTRTAGTSGVRTPKVSVSSGTSSTVVDSSSVGGDGDGGSSGDGNVMLLVSPSGGEGVELGVTPPASPFELVTPSPQPHAHAQPQGRAKASFRESDGRHCSVCSEPYGFLRRRKKQCKNCGSAVCTDCSSRKVQLPGSSAKAVRVCDVCFLLFAKEGATAAPLDANQSLLHSKAVSGNNAVSMSKRQSTMSQSFVDLVGDKKHKQQVQEAVLRTFRKQLRGIQKKIIATMDEDHEQKKQPIKERVSKLKEKMKGLAVAIEKMQSEYHEVERSIAAAIGLDSHGLDAQDLHDRLNTRERRKTHARTKSKNKVLGNGDDEDDGEEEEDDDDDDPEEVKLLKRRKEELMDRIQRAQAKYRDFRSEANNAELEYYFPANRNWKLRFCVEDGTFIAAKDVSVEKVTGEFHVLANRGRRILVTLTNVRAMVQLYNFKLAGKKALVKMLGAILSPSLVAVEVEADEILIPLIYRSSRSAGGFAAGDAGSTEDKIGGGIFEEDMWDMDSTAVFNLRVAKKIKGAASAPDKFVQWLANTLMPKLIRKAVRAFMPTDIAEFLSNPCNQITVGGVFDVSGDVPSQVWHADMSEDTEASLRARELVNLNAEQVAVLATLCKAGKFHQNMRKVSLKNMFAYFMEFSTDPLSWITLIDLWQMMLNSSNPVLASESMTWFSDVWAPLEQLGRKFININYHMTSMDISVDVQDATYLITDLYIRSLEIAVEAEAKAKAAGKSRKTGTAKLLQDTMSPLERMTQARKDVEAVQDIIAQAAKALTDVSLSVSGDLKGGSDGSFGVDAREVAIEGVLPLFVFDLPSYVSRVPAVRVESVATEDNAYAFHIELRDPIETWVTYPFYLMLCDVNAQLFAARTPGSISAHVRRVEFKGRLAPLLHIKRFFELAEAPPHRDSVSMPEHMVAQMQQDGGSDTASDYTNSSAGTSPDKSRPSALSRMVRSSSASPTSKSTASVGAMQPSRTHTGGRSGLSGLAAPPAIRIVPNSVPNSPAGTPRGSASSAASADRLKINTAVAALSASSPNSPTQDDSGDALGTHPMGRAFRGLSVAQPEPVERDIFTMALEYLTLDVHQLRVKFATSVDMYKLDSTSRVIAAAASTSSLPAEASQLTPEPSMLFSADHAVASDDFKEMNAVMVKVATAGQEELVDVSVRTDLQGVLADIMSLT